MAVKLIANYSKRLGLPGYSSHQFSVSVETEVVNVDNVGEESRRLYQLLQQSVDREIQTTGFVPPDGYGMNDISGEQQHRTDARWNCSDKQREFLERLVGENALDRHEVEALAKDRFSKGVRQLNKLEMSGLLDELLERVENNGKRPGSRRRDGAYRGRRST